MSKTSTVAIRRPKTYKPFSLSGNVYDASYNYHGKQTFLADAKRLATAIGHALSIHGYGSQSIRVNRGGDAVSGEVYATYHKPYQTYWIICEITQSSLPLSSREDRVTIRACWRKFSPSGYIEGPNNWINANLNSNEIALQLMAILPAV